MAKAVIFKNMALYIYNHLNTYEKKIELHACVYRIFFIYLYKIISDKDMYRMLVANRYHKTI